ncbi:MAG: 3-phosphoshikimate 1-carboxyvinyltransferase [Sphingomicrobium sp.]
MRLVARAGGPLTGEAIIPGDKSCSHRALIFGAMAAGETRIEGLLESADVMATARAVVALGATVERQTQGEWLVAGVPWRSPAGPIDCGNSGTAARLLAGAIAGMEGVTVTLTGDESLSARPMRRVIAPLERMGARIDGGERLPLTIHGQRLGGIVHCNVPASAQVKSAILLAGLGTSAPVEIVEPVPSRDHSEIMLRQFGCAVGIEQGAEGLTVVLGTARTLTATRLAIGGDPSSAAFPLIAAAIIPGSSIVVRGINVNPLRTGLYETLEAMGADFVLDHERLQSGEPIADMHVAHAPLRPCHVRADSIPAMVDEIPALAMACALADGESVIEGLSELKVKESDRLGAIVAGLAACGVVAIVEGDALHIFGRGAVRGGGRIVTHGDHRIAMAFLTLGLAAQQPVDVDQAGMIATSFPGYAEAMRSIGARIEEAG